MKKITSNLKGRTHLQRELIDIIDKHKREEEDRGKAHVDGAPLPTLKEELVAERSEAQKKGKEKDPMMKSNVQLMRTEPISLLELSIGRMSLAL